MTKRLLFYGEGPANTTGFSLVNRHLADALHTQCDMTFVASTHYKEVDSYPYKLIACPPGNVEKPGLRNLDAALAYVNAGEWDIFFYQGDIGANDDVLLRAAQVAGEDPTKTTVYYVPLDVDDVLPECFDMLRAMHVPVLYTRQGVRMIERVIPELVGKLSAIGLGTEPDVFYPLGEDGRRAARQKIFHMEPDDNTFLVINVNRNQARKDLARTMAYWHVFHQQHPDSMLYMHSVIQDFGGNLMLQARMGGCDIHKQPSEIAFSGLDLNVPWSRADLNELYNAADCLISTSYGEGWGLTTAEAMCAGCPVVVPFNTANIDLIGENQERGWGMKTGGDPDHTVFLYEGGGAPHDIVHCDSFVENLERVAFDPWTADDKAKAALAWCLDNSWETHALKWQALIHIIAEGGTL